MFRAGLLPVAPLQESSCKRLFSGRDGSLRPLPALGRPFAVKSTNWSWKYFISTWSFLMSSLKANYIWMFHPQLSFLSLEASVNFVLCCVHPVQGLSPVCPPLCPPCPSTTSRRQRRVGLVQKVVDLLGRAFG